MTSKKSLPPEDSGLSVVKVEVVKQKQRRHTHTAAPYEGPMKGTPKVSSRSNDFAYVNTAYVGSLNSVNEIRINEQPVSVYREQYWTCSKWSFAKRALAIAACVALGAVVGLVVTLVIKQRGKPEDIIGGIFKSSAPD